ncbi:hypothetical protein PVAP13_1KG014493, partial [Panicum virgatum]
MMRAHTVATPPHPPPRRATHSLSPPSPSLSLLKPSPPPPPPPPPPTIPARRPLPFAHPRNPLLPRLLRASLHLSAPPSLPILTTRRALPPPGFLWSALLSPPRPKTLGSPHHFPSLFFVPPEDEEEEEEPGGLSPPAPV